MNNMFESTYFGKAYKTEDGRKALYHMFHGTFHELILPNGILLCNSDGTHRNNEPEKAIVSEWQEPIVCKCKWKDYYDYRIMFPNGEGHVRLSFFIDEIIISDLYVSEKHRNKGYATTLLNKVDELLDGRKAIIYPLEKWQAKWYEQRGYIIGKEDSIDEEKIDELATDADYRIAAFYNTCGWTVDDYYREGFKAGYRKAKQN